MTEADIFAHLGSSGISPGSTEEVASIAINLLH